MSEKWRAIVLKLSSIDICFLLRSDSSSSLIWASILSWFPYLPRSSSNFFVYFSKYSRQFLFWRGNASSAWFFSAMSVLSRGSSVCPFLSLSAVSAWTFGSKRWTRSSCVSIEKLIY